MAGYLIGRFVLNCARSTKAFNRAVSFVIQSHELQAFLDSFLDLVSWTFEEEAEFESQDLSCCHVVIEDWVLSEVSDSSSNRYTFALYVFPVDFSLSLSGIG